MIVLATYVFAALVIGLYIWWFMRRYRREQREKAAEAERTEQQFRTVLPPIERTPPPTATSTSTPASTPATAATPSPAAASGGGGARTVAEALSGISIPHDLVPLTTIPPRPGAVDQVAFSSKSAVSVIGPLFADELERLGYTLTPLDDTSMAAKRGNDNLLVYLHAEPVGTAPEGSVVVEVCVPF